jgi:hypothetical protein
VVIVLVPPTHTDLPYAELMLGISQLNQAVDNQSLGVMAKLHKSIGLLLFYADGDHSLTVHAKTGDQIVKSVSVDKIAAHLQGIDPKSLALSTRVIYLPLDTAMLKEDPRVSLDSLPAQIFPAF